MSCATDNTYERLAQKTKQRPREEAVHVIEKRGAKGDVTQTPARQNSEAHACAIPQRNKRQQPEAQESTDMRDPGSG